MSTKKTFFQETIKLNECNESKDNYSNENCNIQIQVESSETPSIVTRHTVVALREKLKQKDNEVNDLKTQLNDADQKIKLLEKTTRRSN